ncbi:hypothetical protein FRC04_008991 [Tulasnella sp. 424]|nr:hypothetical protein FRC04_008991 [Tulasnella sp. 424]
MPSLNPVSTAATLVGAAALYKVLQIGRRDDDLPPGPPTRPIVGNLLDFPISYAHLTFEKWAREYGEIFSLKIANGTIISLNSPQAVRFVLDKKNSSTSNRPELYVLNYITNGLFLGFMQAGPEWKIMRRAVTDILKPQAVDRHLPIQYAESAQFMFDLMSKPEEHYNHCARYAVSVVVSIVFGQRIPRHNSPLAATFRGNSEMLDYLLQPGNTPPVDLIPALKMVPERFAKWKTVCRTQREHIRSFYDGLVSMCEERMKRGDGNGCFVETLLERRESLGMTREMIMYLGEGLVEPGEDSARTYLQNLLLLLLAHPEVQERAKLEADRVVGPDRLPTLEDVKHMPYARAVMDEACVPHASSEEVIYKNYRIPEKSMIFFNTWAIYHDENLFDHPYEFRPERFLESPQGTKEGIDPQDVANLKDLPFGSGRRICPGIHLARQLEILNTARILWGFEVLKARGPDGSIIEPDLSSAGCKPNASNGPKPFAAHIRVRSTRHAQAIQREFLETSGSSALFEHEIDEDDKAFLREAKRSAEQASQLTDLTSFPHYTQLVTKASLKMDLLQGVSLTAIAVAGTVALVIIKLLSMGQRESDLPPGPPTRPLIGNLLDVPLTKPYLAFTTLKTYGDICSLKIGSGTVVVLNSLDAVHHVLVTCNAATASRPDLYILDYLTGGFYLILMKYDSNWRILRRAAMETLNPQAVDQHKSIQAAEAAQLIRYAASVVAAIVYGRRLPRVNSHIIRTLQENTEVIDSLAKPGATPPVDLIPALHYIPERWAKWKTLIRVQRGRRWEFYNQLLRTVETRIKEGRANDCLMENLLNNQEELGITREMITCLGPSLLEPGEDSTQHFMQNLIRIMVTHHEDQKRAQDEIDRVVGRDRMPTLEDVSSLPYVRAIVNELLNTALLLWGFDMTKAKRADGTEIEIDTTDCKDVRG